MNSYERVIAALLHKPTDCVPVIPVMLMQGAAELGLDLSTYFSRGAYLAQGQMRLLEKFGHDAVLGVPHVVEDITAFGAALIVYENGPPAPGSMVIHSYEEVGRLRVPDPASSPMLAETLTAIEQLAHHLKGEVPILGACIAPFSLPSMLMGTERWMELLFLEAASVRDPLLDHMLDVTTQFCATWANMQLSAGADAIVLADGMASAAVLTRQQFIDFALPTLRAVVPRIQGPVIHEGVGHLQPMLDLLADVGLVGVMLTNDDDLARAKALVGDRLALIGNLNNVEMRRWTAEEMELHAQAALAQGAPGGGFILANQGPEIPLGTSDAAIHAMVLAAHGWRS